MFTPYTQLKKFPVVSGAGIVGSDVLYVNKGGIDSALPISALVNISSGGISGAVGDGITDDTVAIQAAFTAISLTQGGIVEFGAGKNYKITASIELPRVLSNGKKVIVNGNGATLTGVGAISILKRVPVSQTEANTMIDATFIFEALNIVGDGTAGQIGIDLGATYASVIRDCNFTGLDTGLDLKFCLMARVQSCRAGFNVTRSFVAQYGTWTGATNSNSQSNHTVFEQCRVYNANGASSAYYVFGSSGCHISNCIAEGGNPVNNIEIDTDGATVVKFNKITNLHSENTPTNSVIKAKTSGGLILIDGLFHQSVCVLVDASLTVSYGLIRISNVVYINVGSQFKHAGVGAVFVFDYMGATGQADLSNTSYWVGGTLPNFWSHIGHNAAGGVYPKFEGVTGPWIENDLYMVGTLSGTDAAGVTPVRLLNSTRGAAVADATGATLADTTAQLNALLARIRAHGLIA